jgi:hypothetical protein
LLLFLDYRDHCRLAETTEQVTAGYDRIPHDKFDDFSRAAAYNPSTFSGKGHDQAFSVVLPWPR